MAIDVETETLTIRQLRRRWKPHKERLTAEQPENPTPIRFHRACSWIAPVEQNAANEDHDLGLISLWIAFNSLYGQWDQQKREPKPDRESARKFIDRILELDHDEVVANALKEHKRLVMSLLEDEYLSGYFWQEPSAKRAGQSKKAMYDARTWYMERRWALILDRLLERVYLMRCQLVHGAATYGGKLNRTSLRRCVMMMQRLLPAFLLVWADHGADEDWGPMCYPPLGPMHESASESKHRLKQPR
jgi:hypothetical protein